ncbi:MAG: glycosyltransferase family 4 protein [Ignavibacteria bacterium]|nr:glycosyltransferase family 4 protein [Ignavibacteria bacterium]
MKKVLIISYYFPPMGMGGVQRTAKFAKYLNLYGWQAYVLTVSPKIYLAEDYCLLEDTRKAGVTIFRTGKEITERNGHKVIEFKKDSNRKFLSNLSQTFLIPDSKIFWKRKAVQLGEKIITENKIDLIFATAPPYTDFLIGCELKEKYGLPLVSDYRDSWADCPNNFYPTAFHRKLHGKLERKVLDTSDKVITINKRIKELLIERYPFIEEDKISVIPHGFDSEDFLGFKPEKAKDKFRISYAGSFMNYYTPEYFLEALKIINETYPEKALDIEAVFIGTFPEKYKRVAEDYGISSMITYTGYLKHSDCVKMLMDSDVLWMMIKKTAKSDLHSTGKLYEYFGTKKPIIACVPEGTARNSLEGHGAAIITEPDSSKQIADAVLKFYDLYKSGQLPSADESFIRRYDRKYLAGMLAEEFNQLVPESEKLINR